jgi:hypothetical protein
MSQTPPAANGGSPPSDRLDGWKEVAAHIGRGVRTAQRWERDLGLPVRRLGTGGGEVVYAFKEDLDSWLARHSRLGVTEHEQIAAESSSNGSGDGGGEAEARGADRDAGPRTVTASSPGTSQPARQPAGPPAGWRRRTVWFVAAAAMLAALGALGWFQLARSPESGSPVGTDRAEPPAEPTELEVVGDALNVRGPNHELLWSHSFDVPLLEISPSTPAGRRALLLLSSIRDLKQSGQKDVLVARSSPDDRRLYCFDHSGNVRFRHRVDADIRFGAYACSEIRLNRLFMDVDSGNRGTFWIAGHDKLGQFPAVLRHLDADGRAIGEDYWSAGFISAMAAVDLGGRRVVLVGSSANETGGAALAVFEGPVRGAAPSANPAYRCSGCPTGGPSPYLVFPRSRLQKEMGVCAAVFEIASTAVGTIQVTVVVAGVPGHDEPVGLAYYTLDRDFRVVDAKLGSGFGTVQRQYEAKEWVSASTRFRGDRDFYPVRRWNQHRKAYDLIAGPEKPAHTAARAATK